MPYRAGAAADQAGYVHAAGQSLDDLADMFAQARAGLLPATPMVGVINEAGIDPSRAPDGKALMKFVMHFVPYRVTGDARGRIGGTNWDEIKETYADAMIDFISETYLPGLRDRIIARAVQSPVDLERRIKSGTAPTSTAPISLIRSGRCAPSPNSAPTARRLPTSICAAPAATRVPA